ncbi:MAG TPA: hypothetical protein H9821_09210 [Candidatus Rothia avicola]|uniref:Alkaline shock response membrane anchor protein AmaP n=1 Tax=Candidatus Rothia avicola TaxID=2840478 RepID=A0A9D1ZXE1_9MICC|nr:hypothetical protein [Candidatus Rothia avicola]
MAKAPRALNRFFLGAVGLILIALGAASIALATLAQIQDFWRDYIAPVEGKLEELFASSALTIRGEQTSLITLLALLLLVLIIGLLIWLIIKQVSGRTPELLSQEDPVTAGSTTITHRFIKQALTEAFEQQDDVLAVSVSPLYLKKRSGVQVKLEVRRGADILRLQEKTASIVQGLDILLGQRLPLAVRVTGGLRSTFQKDSFRVR